MAFEAYNAENIFIKSPRPGVYKITVKCYSIPDGPQKYALVTSGALGAATPSPNPTSTLSPASALAPGPSKTADITQIAYVNSTYSRTYKLYYMNVTTPGQIKANLEWWNNSDLDVYLFDPDWKQVRRSAGKSNPEAFTYYATKTGRYCIKVNAYSGGAAYVLTSNHPYSPGATGILTGQGHLNASGSSTKNAFYVFRRVRPAA